MDADESSSERPIDAEKDIIKGNSERPTHSAEAVAVPVQQVTGSDVIFGCVRSQPRLLKRERQSSLLTTKQKADLAAAASTSIGRPVMTPTDTSTAAAATNPDTQDAPTMPGCDGSGVEMASNQCDDAIEENENRSCRKDVTSSEDQDAEQDDWPTVSGTDDTNTSTPTTTESVMAVPGELVKTSGQESGLSQPPTLAVRLKRQQSKNGGPAMMSSSPIIRPSTSTRSTTRGGERGATVIRRRSTRFIDAKPIVVGTDSTQPGSIRSNAVKSKWRTLGTRASAMNLFVGVGQAEKRQQRPMVRPKSGVGEGVRTGLKLAVVPDDNTSSTAKGVSGNNESTIAVLAGSVLTSHLKGQLTLNFSFLPMHSLHFILLTHNVCIIFRT